MMRPMSEDADRYRALAATLTERLEAVPPDRWSSPSPCEGWTTADVVAHIVETQNLFLGQVDRTIGEHPDPATDPIGAWTVARDVVQAALDDPEIATAGYDGWFGPTTLEATVGDFGCFDLLVHGWDIARAAGLDESLDPDEVHRNFETAKSRGDMIRTGGVCGPPVTVPDDADEQTRFLAFLGRTP